MMNYDKFLKTNAEELKINAVSKKIIDKYVIHHLIRINDEINTAYDDKRTSIKYDMEYIFDDIPNMSNTESQIMIYSSIIETLKNKNYEVKFVYKDDICYFVITWMTRKDILELRYRQTLIKNCQKPS